jgi:hypothetical protein
MRGRSEMRFSGPPAFHQRGRPIAQHGGSYRGGDGDPCYAGGMSEDVKPKPLFARLALLATAVDVTADAAITAVIGAGRYTLEEQAIIRCIAAAQPDLPLTGVDIDVSRSGAGARRALDLSSLRAVSLCSA